MTAMDSDVPRFDLIDLFSGVGGLTLGFIDRSVEPGCIFSPRLMVDADSEAREVVVRNLPNIPYWVANIHDISGAQLRERAGLGPKDPIHVLVGGPPCQGFSWLGKRALDDERNLLVLDFLRLVKELRPFAVVMENIQLIVTSHGNQIINEVLDTLGSFGYASCADVLLASDHGVPQFRKRAVVLAYRADLGVTPQFPTRSHERINVASHLLRQECKPRFEADRQPYVSVAEAISDLPVIHAGGGDEVMFYSVPPFSEFQRWARSGSVAIFNHRSRAHTTEYLRKISVIGEGGRNSDLPADKRFSDNYYSQAYARLDRNGIAQTITTSFGNPGSGRFTHYQELRSITVREAARFQSFPDAFIFDGLHSTQMRHVGNAVPPLLARALRDQIARDFVAAGVGDPRSIAKPRKAQGSEAALDGSRVMRAVPSKNRMPESAVRKALWAAGLRGFRIHSKEAPGHPDVLFPTQRLAVFVDGCVSHGCPNCDLAAQSQTEYAGFRVTQNRARDVRVTAECEAAGWRVVRVWEHELANPKLAAAKVKRMLNGRPARTQARAMSTATGKRAGGKR